MNVGDSVYDKAQRWRGAGSVIRVADHPTAEVVIDVRFDDGGVSTYFQFNDLELS